MDPCLVLNLEQFSCLSLSTAEIMGVHHQVQLSLLLSWHLFSLSLTSPSTPLMVLFLFFCHTYIYNYVLHSYNYIYKCVVHRRAHVRYLSFWVWFISLNLITSSSIHFPAVDFHCVYGPHFLYSFISWGISMVVLCLVNSAAVNMGVRSLLWYMDLESFRWYTPRCGFPGPPDSSTFSFLRKIHSDFQVNPVYIPSRRDDSSLQVLLQYLLLFPFFSVMGIWSG